MAYPRVKIDGKLFPPGPAGAQERVVTGTWRVWLLEKAAGQELELWQMSECSLWHPATQQKLNQNLEGKDAVGVAHVLCLLGTERWRKGETGVHRRHPGWQAFRKTSRVVFGGMRFI